jgi:hypothetical protein
MKFWDMIKSKQSNNHLDGGKLIYERVKKESDQFASAIDLAKKSGKLLAYFLCLDYPMLFDNVDLIGFSLGTQVIKSCLTQLRRLGAYEIIGSIYLMGGATCIHSEDTKIFR